MMNGVLQLVLTSVVLILMACSHFSGKPDSVRAAVESPAPFNFKKVWVRPTYLKDDIGYRKNVRMSPLILKDRIIQGNAFDGIVAVDRQLGHVLWRIPVVGGVEGGATAINDFLFFGGNDGYFYSASISSGQVLWRVPVRAESLAAPLLSDGIVYFMTGNNVLHALDASDGRELWIYSRVDAQSFSVRGAASSVVHDGQLLIGFSDGYLVSLNAKTGSLKWETLLNKNKRFRDLDSTPVIDGNQVYVTGYDSHLYCVNFQTGELLWKAEPGGFGQVLVLKDRLFYSSSNGQVIAIDKKDGHQIWKYNVPEGVATSPTVYKDYLVFGESLGALQILRQSDGKAVGHLSPGHGISSPIAIDEANDEFYFISNSAWLYKVKGLCPSEGDLTPWLM